MLIFSELLSDSALPDGALPVSSTPFDSLPVSSPPVSGELRLTYEWRQKSRFVASLVSGPQAGDAVGVRIPRGHVLQEGDLLGCRSKTDAQLVQVIRVCAAAEQLLQITAPHSLHLARIAYHLGNRHVPVQVGEDASQRLWLRLQLDHVLENMVDGLGGTIETLSAPFEPESGAYGQGLGMGNSGAAGHEHQQEHVHLHDHEHNHSHEHVHGDASDPHAVRSQGRDHGHDDRRHAPRIHDFLE
jgi:urease accessory protein